MQEIVHGRYGSSPFSPEESRYLEERISRERRQYTRLSALFIVLSLILPLAASRYFDEEDQQFYWSFSYYIIGFAFLAFFSLGSLYFAYRSGLYKIIKDYKKGLKIVERAKILNKRFIPSNKSFHFYIDSGYRSNLEVTADEFQSLEQGDEINILYTPVSLIYLGYY